MNHELRSATRLAGSIHAGGSRSRRRGRGRTRGSRTRGGFRAKDDPHAPPSTTPTDPITDDPPRIPRFGSVTRAAGLAGHRPLTPRRSVVLCTLACGCTLRGTKIRCTGSYGGWKWRTNHRPHRFQTSARGADTEPTHPLARTRRYSLPIGACKGGRNAVDWRKSGSTPRTDRQAPG